MANVCVIIPMNEFLDEYIELLKKAVDSVKEGIKVILSCPKNTSNEDLKKVPSRCEIVNTSESDSFQSLVNEGAAKCGEKWFSILEFDDTYTDIWFDSFEKYLEYRPNVSVFMPLEDVTDFNNGDYLILGNAEAHAASFSNELGYIDLDCLQEYFDFYMTRKHLQYR